jgi:hypothetical protein
MPRQYENNPILLAYSKSIIGIIYLRGQKLLFDQIEMLFCTGFIQCFPEFILYVSEVLMVPPTKVAIPIASIISSLVTPIL